MQGRVQNLVYGDDAERRFALRQHCAVATSRFACVVLTVALTSLSGAFLGGGAAASVANPVEVAGARRMLVVPVRFAGIDPESGREALADKTERVNRYIRISSYGRTWIEPTITDWVDLPSPLADYRISAYNYGVDKSLVRRLLADALGSVRNRTGPGAADPTAFDLVWIVVGARTAPGEGYGMISYAANPGMLSGVVRRSGHRAAMEAVDLAGGGRYAGAAIVSAVNAHLGHVVHDLLHALGGVNTGSRVVPDLYDYDMQSDPNIAHTSPAPFAPHLGPWDVMSEHWIERQRPPPPPSSFTRLQLGWIASTQVVTVTPGETREVTLAPLASGVGALVVRVPLAQGRYLLIENRQPVGGDAVLPLAGMLVLEVDTGIEEGGGIVRAADANPGVPGLRAAPFRPGAGERRAYLSRAADVAVAPLAVAADGTLRLVVTTRGRIDEILSALPPR